MNHNVIEPNIFCDLVPPAYKRPLNTLRSIKTKRGYDIVPYDLVFSVFQGYRLSRKKTIAALELIEETGAIKNIPFHGIRINEAIE